MHQNGPHTSFIIIKTLPAIFSFVWATISSLVSSLVSSFFFHFLPFLSLLYKCNFHKTEMWEIGEFAGWCGVLHVGLGAVLCGVEVRKGWMKQLRLGGLEVGMMSSICLQELCISIFQFISKSNSQLNCTSSYLFFITSIHVFFGLSLLLDGPWTSISNKNRWYLQ